MENEIEILTEFLHGLTPDDVGMMKCRRMAEFLVNVKGYTRPPQEQASEGLLSTCEMKLKHKAFQDQPAPSVKNLRETLIDLYLAGYHRAELNEAQRSDDIDLAENKIRQLLRGEK